jgi:Xaa-Pro aminopeptidase
VESDIAEQIGRRRRAVAERWDLGETVVVIGAGELIGVPGRGDITYPYRAHSEYFYLTDRQRPGGALAFDTADGWTEFVVPVSRDERVWEGAPDDADGAAPIDELVGWLARRSGRPVAWLGSRVGAVDSAALRCADLATVQHLRSGLNHVRREKDPVELERMRTAERATRAGFAAVVALLEPGRTERHVKIEIEAEFLRAGGDSVAFETIVGSGPNSAVLHFPPSDRVFQAGEQVLIDAGAEVRGYASDVTRTLPVSGQFDPEHAAVVATVLAANRAATAAVVAGAEFRDIHHAAARVIAEGLIEFGVLRGGIDGLLERGAVSLFFPHGVGHLVGLGVRDAGEVLPGRGPRTGAPALRADLPVLPGYVVTIEPGVYFIEALLGERDTRARHRDSVNWDRVDALLGFGGVRIEHDVLVTRGAPEVLTADIPQPV